MADFGTGMVHWGCDTWGTCETPLISTFVWSFREHHVDPKAITRHDWIQTNADNCMVAAFLLCIFLSGAFFKLQMDTISSYVWYCSLLWLFILTALTNQFHSWAHSANPPAFAQWLQRNRIILNRVDHRDHHHNPFDCSYTITNGWLNAPLNKIGFFRGLEFAITRTFGFLPRQDDQIWQNSTPEDLAKRTQYPTDPKALLIVVALDMYVAWLSVSLLHQRLV